MNCVCVVSVRQQLIWDAIYIPKLLLLILRKTCLISLLYFALILLTPVNSSRVSIRQKKLMVLCTSILQTTQIIKEELRYLSISLSMIYLSVSLFLSNRRDSLTKVNQIYKYMTHWLIKLECSLKCKIHIELRSS